MKAAPAQLSSDTGVLVDADEMNRCKVHNSLTVFTDVVAKVVLLARPDKNASV